MDNSKDILDERLLKLVDSTNRLVIGRKSNLNLAHVHKTFFTRKADCFGDFMPDPFPIERREDYGYDADDLSVQISDIVYDNEKRGYYSIMCDNVPLSEKYYMMFGENIDGDSDIGVHILQCANKSCPFPEIDITFERTRTIEVYDPKLKRALRFTLQCGNGYVDRDDAILSLWLLERDSHEEKIYMRVFLLFNYLAWVWHNGGKVHYVDAFGITREAKNVHDATAGFGGSTDEGVTSLTRSIAQYIHSYDSSCLISIRNRSLLVGSIVFAVKHLENGRYAVRFNERTCGGDFSNQAGMSATECAELIVVNAISDIGRVVGNRGYVSNQFTFYAEALEEE